MTSVPVSSNKSPDSARIRFSSESPLVYIIILNWHGWRDTIACLHSLQQLTYPNYRVLVVDNGSTDESIERIRSVNPEIPIIETCQNLGFSGGCNVGILRAFGQQAEYVWLLNNDTVVDPQALTAMVIIAENNRHVGAVGSVVYHYDNPTKVQAWGGGTVNLWSGRNTNHTHRSTKKNLTHIYGASILVRSDALKHVGLLDEDSYFLYWEENDLCFRLRKAGWTLYTAEQSRIYHKESASLSGQSGTKHYHFTKSMVHFLTSYAPIPIIPLFVALARRMINMLVHKQFDAIAPILQGAKDGALEVLSRRGAIAFFIGESWRGKTGH